MEKTYFCAKMQVIVGIIVIMLFLMYSMAIFN